MPAPKEVLDLIERFDRNREAYLSGQYNEAQVRREFIDPFFEALGWDITNKAGDAEAYKQVVHEDAIKIGGATKAPDYSFRIGGTRKFFLEAKKPSINIVEDPNPAYQLRRYAWSAKLPLSILTNFKDFVVYDCRKKPLKTEKASAARIMCREYTEYPQCWDEIDSIFSHDAIRKGSFDKYAESSKQKKGTTEVDTAFLNEIEHWRDILARNIAVRNNLSQRELNFAVQRIIDRLIFLRICEDRGIEHYGRLLALQNGVNSYKRLCKLYQDADDKYNSGLFHFRAERDRAEEPDEISLSLELDDAVLKNIIRNLYYPDSPYEFSVLPADILGQVYEQFLGKIIRLTSGGHVKVEPKPEVRKAGGVYYTPSYIVNHVVKNTVGALIDGKTPRQVSKIRILDPACGSGSFLINAYQLLLDWHRDQYFEDGPQKHKNELFPANGGWRLTTAEKKRILLNNIYGVDIDSQAVEITKLSLLLKVLEGENEETINKQLRLLHQRALPDLGNNIKCGNSLIEHDFYNNQQMNLLDENEKLAVNAFDWNNEFPEIMKGGGFDAVIGNPPWGQKGIKDSEDTKEYVKRKFTSSAGIYDIFRPFVERGIQLTNEHGMFGMVLPDIILLKDYPETRLHILENLGISAIDWWGMAFASAVIDATTIIGIKGKADRNHNVHVSIMDPENPLSHTIKQADFLSNPRYAFNLFLTPDKRKILKKLDKFPKVGDYFEIHEGVHSGNIRADLFITKSIDKTCRKLYFGRDEIHPYLLEWAGQYIRLGAAPGENSKKRYSNLGRPEWYRQDKVLIRRTGDFVLAAVDRERLYASNNFFIVFPKQPCFLNLDGLCALLNSSFMTWYFQTIEPRKGRVFAEIKIKHISTFPLPSGVSDADCCVEINELGAKRKDLAVQTIKCKTPMEKNQAERMAHYIDEKIDALMLKIFNWV